MEGEAHGKVCETEVEARKMQQQEMSAILSKFAQNCEGESGRKSVAGGGGSADFPSAKKLGGERGGQGAAIGAGTWG